ncbi:MAG: cytochrome c [Caulobacteraceae bacterium]|nr:cytochrome c [Caulobacteraceae bacterium]
MWIYLLLGLLFSDANEGPSRLAGPPDDMTASAIRGEMSVRRRCASCHAVSTDDASPYPGAPPLRVVAGRYPVQNLEEALAEGIYVGHRGPMPPFALEADEIADITAYLRTLRTADADPADPS